MGQLKKGKIASVKGNMVRVIPFLGSYPQPAINATIPKHLYSTKEDFCKGTSVAYAEFDDGTGLILGCTD